MALCNFDKSNSLWFDKEVNYLIILLTRLVSLKFSEFVNHHFNYQEDDHLFGGKLYLIVYNLKEAPGIQRNIPSKYYLYHFYYLIFFLPHLHIFSISNSLIISITFTSLKFTFWVDLNHYAFKRIISGYFIITFTLQKIILGS